MQKTATFLMFTGNKCGKAEEAIKFYTTLFPNSEIKEIVRFKEGEFGGKPGQIKTCRFTLSGLEYMAMESDADHQFTFTPAISIFVNCDSEKEINQLFQNLSQEGSLFMPLDNYGFSKKFGWTSDKYGVSWQLNLKA